MKKPVFQRGEVLTAAKLQSVVEYIEAMSARVSGPGLSLNGRSISLTGRPPCRVYLTGGGGISARVTTTPGSGTCTLYRFNGSTLASETVTETVYNISSVAVAGSTYILAEIVDGFPFVVVESCS